MYFRCSLKALPKTLVQNSESCGFWYIINVHAITRQRLQYISKVVVIVTNRLQYIYTVTRLLSVIYSDHVFTRHNLRLTLIGLWHVHCDVICIPVHYVVFNYKFGCKETFSGIWNVHLIKRITFYSFSKIS